LAGTPSPSAGIVDSQSVKTTGVGGTERGFDPAKKAEGRKRHLLVVDTEGLVLGARVHSAKEPDQDGIRLLLDPARDRLGRLLHLWVDAGYQGRARRWAEEVSGSSVEIVRRPRKPLPEEVAKVWAEAWAKEGGEEVDWQRLMPPKGFPGVGAQVGGGAHLRVDLPQPEDGKRPREAVRHRGGLRLRGDDAADGAAVGRCVGVSRQSLYEVG